MLWVWVGTETGPLFVPKLLTVVMGAEGPVESDDDCPGPWGDSRRRTGSADLGLIVTSVSLEFPRPLARARSSFVPNPLPAYVRCVPQNLRAVFIELWLGVCLPGQAQQTSCHVLVRRHSTTGPPVTCSRKKHSPNADPCPISRHPLGTWAEYGRWRRVMSEWRPLLWPYSRFPRLGFFSPHFSPLPLSSVSRAPERG